MSNWSLPETPGLDPRRWAPKLISQGVSTSGGQGLSRNQLRGFRLQPTGSQRESGGEDQMDFSGKGKEFRRVNPELSQSIAGRFWQSLGLKPWMASLQRLTMFLNPSDFPQRITAMHSEKQKLHKIQVFRFWESWRYGWAIVGEREEGVGDPSVYLLLCPPTSISIRKRCPVQRTGRVLNTCGK